MGWAAWKGVSFPYLDVAKKSWVPSGGLWKDLKREEVELNDIGGPFQLPDSLQTCTRPGSLKEGVPSGFWLCSAHISSYHHWSLALDLLTASLLV